MAVNGGHKDVPSDDYIKLYLVHTAVTSNKTHETLKLVLQNIQPEQSGTYYCKVDKLQLYKNLDVEVRGKFLSIVPTQYH